MLHIFGTDGVVVNFRVLLAGGFRRGDTLFLYQIYLQPSQHFNLPAQLLRVRIITLALFVQLRTLPLHSGLLSLS